jgi:hypothetical protein
MEKITWISVCDEHRNGRMIEFDKCWDILKRYSLSGGINSKEFSETYNLFYRTTRHSEIKPVEFVWIINRNYNRHGKPDNRWECCINVFLNNHFIKEQLLGHYGKNGSWFIWDDEFGLDQLIIIENRILNNKNDNT